MKPTEAAKDGQREKHAGAHELQERAWPQGTETSLAVTLLQEISHKSSATVEAESIENTPLHTTHNTFIE